MVTVLPEQLRESVRSLMLRWSGLVGVDGAAIALQVSGGGDVTDVILTESRQASYGRRVTSDFEAQLRAVSLRVTRPRLAVLAALRDHPHVDTHRVIALVRDDLPTVSHQAIYDVLQVLTESGLVRRIQPAGATARYETRVGDNHHHVVCRFCGAIADVDCAVGQAPCLTVSDDHGYVIDEAEVVLWGTCPDCAAERTPTIRQFGRK